jgi:hypothetical protein
MSLLDLQALEAPAESNSSSHHGGDGGSEASLLLCDSAVSFLLCL